MSHHVELLMGAVLTVSSCRNTLFGEMVSLVAETTFSLIEGGPHHHVEGKSAELGNTATPILACRL